MRREIVAVDGVHFERSEIGLGKQLSRCPGIVRVSVDAQAGLADILYDEARTTPTRLRELIAQYGYSVASTPVCSPPRRGGRGTRLEDATLARQERVAQLG